MTSIRNIQSQMADVYGEFRDIYTRLPVSTVKKLFSEIRRIREDAINSGINYYSIEKEIASDVFGSMSFAENPAVIELICMELPYLIKRATIYTGVCYGTAKAYHDMLVDDLRNFVGDSDFHSAINIASRFYLFGYGTLFISYIKALATDLMDSSLTPDNFWTPENSHIPASSITDMLNIYHDILSKSKEPIDRHFEGLIYSLSEKYLKPGEMIIAPNEESIISIVSSGRFIKFGELGCMLRLRNSGPKALFSIINSTDLHKSESFIKSISSMAKDPFSRELCKIKLFLNGNEFATLRSVSCLFETNYEVDAEIASWAITPESIKDNPGQFDKLGKILMMASKDPVAVAALLKAASVPDDKIIAVTGSKSLLTHEMGL